MPAAARLGDFHRCSSFTGPIPHVGGGILPSCSADIEIDFKPAARTLDKASCFASAPDVLAMGCPSVIMNSQLAVRVGDLTAHGGSITVGSGTVEIGMAGDGAAVIPIKTLPNFRQASRQNSPQKSGVSGKGEQSLLDKFKSKLPAAAVDGTKQGLEAGQEEGQKQTAEQQQEDLENAVDEKRQSVNDAQDNADAARENASELQSKAANDAANAQTTVDNMDAMKSADDANTASGQSEIADSKLKSAQSELTDSQGNLESFDPAEVKAPIEIPSKVTGALSVVSSGMMVKTTYDGCNKILADGAAGDNRGVLVDAGETTGDLVGGMAGAEAGAAVGAEIGLIGGPVGALVGGVVGGIAGGVLGAVGGSEAFGMAGDMIADEKGYAPRPNPPAEDSK